MLYLPAVYTHTHTSLSPLSLREANAKSLVKKKQTTTTPIAPSAIFVNRIFPFFLLLLHRCSAIFFFSQHPIRAPIESLKTINQAKPFIPVYCASSNPLAFGATVEHLDLSLCAAPEHGTQCIVSREGTIQVHTRSHAIGSSNRCEKQRCVKTVTKRGYKP